MTPQLLLVVKLLVILCFASYWLCHDPFPKTPHIVHQPPKPPKGPPTLRRTSAHAPRLLWLTPTPPRLTPTAPWPTSVPALQPLTLTLGLPNPENHPHCSRSSPPHHQLNTLTYSGVSRQPRGNPRSPMIPSTYQRGTILDHNRHLPPPSSSAKPRRHSRRTPKSSGSQSEPHSSLGPGPHQLQMISHQIPAPFPLITQPPTPSLPQISRTAFCLNPAKTVSFPHDPTSPDLPGSVWITAPQLPAQATRARNVFECSVTNAGESRPPSKDSPSAAEPPGSAEPDRLCLYCGGCWFNSPFLIYFSLILKDLGKSWSLVT
ncbi:hypothetical protein H2248_012493 [Termitomyces sp. 'cryptogamus']|nr:hypothetical protein H2248_012493 [Termitomyces sp. 'cryptogamus']